MEGVMTRIEGPVARLCAAAAVLAAAWLLGRGPDVVPTKGDGTGGIGGRPGPVQDVLDCDGRTASILARIAARDAVRVDLLTGRVTLLEAAARFRALAVTDHPE